MQIRRTPLTDAVCALFAALAICAVAVGLSSSAPVASAASVGQLQNRISAGQGQISSLSGTVHTATDRIHQLDASIAALGRRLSRIQADLNTKRAELAKLRSQLAAARIRLSQLEAYEAYAERVLAQQLVATYESDRPNIVTVVLDATGFQDLLERLAFMQKISKQDIEVTNRVRTAREAVAAEATQLGKLEVRQQVLVADVLAQRDALARTNAGLEQQRRAVAQFRYTKTSELVSARAEVGRLQNELSQLEAAQAALAAREAAQAAAQAAARAAAQSASSAGSPGSSAASVSSGSAGSSAPSPAPSAPSAPVSGGGFTFPLPKSAAAPPSAWSPDQGVDISAPGNTPEYAVCSGTIVLHGIGGFGPWAPVLHCDGSIAGYSYVYYGHAGPLYQLPIGTHVGAGQVMSSIGPGDVGISTGPHLELGFADSSGSPIGSQTAGTMLSLLQAAYGG
jgi:septal ring factor EnvC (AmiA/AmiB activator)